LPASTTEGRVEDGGTFDPEVPDDFPERTPLRSNFPAAGEQCLGGDSDGYCFTIVFAAGRLERTYDLVREFLREQGFGEVAIPADVAELKAFRLPPKLRHQLSLFGEDGYVHNPLKILFPAQGGKRGALVLKIYREAAEGHLLRFHGRIK
jgi:hypothetical protein